MQQTSPRLQRAAKLAAEMTKTQEKIEALQERYRELEQQKTELENTEIVAQFRSLEATPSEIAAFLAAFRASGTLPSAPVATPATEPEPALDLAEDGETADSYRYGSGYKSNYSREDD